jgi:hypothetical protein
VLRLELDPFLEQRDRVAGVLQVAIRPGHDAAVDGREALVDASDVRQQLRETVVFQGDGGAARDERLLEQRGGGGGEGGDAGAGRVVGLEHGGHVDGRGALRDAAAAGRQLGDKQACVT